MKIEHIKENKADIAVVSSKEKLIVDVQSALDLAMTVKYETGVQRTTQEVLIAAMAIGYADEAPYKRPRKKLDEIVKWCE